MGLKNLKSNLDVAGGFGGAAGQTYTAQSSIGGPAVKDALPDPNFNTLNGTTDSPFYSKNASGDHLVDLLKDNIVRSTNTTNIYDPQQMKGLQPGPPVPGQDQDLDGVNGGQGYFHGVNNPQIGQGKQIGGVDLHEHLLTQTYTYNHGNSVEQAGPSPGGDSNSPFQDLDGLDGPSFDGGVPSKVHGHQAQMPSPTELVRDYTSTVNPGANYGNSQWPIVPAVPGGNNQNSPFQDLDGTKGPSFHGSVPIGTGQPGSPTLHTDLLANIYQSSINPGASYGAGQPGGTYPSLSPSPLASTPFADLDGGLPPNGEYINNLPQ